MVTALGGHANKIEWSPGPGIKVQSVVSSNEGDWVVSACGPSSGICPDCRHQSKSRHGWSYRSLQDLPIQCNEVTVRLQLRRWRYTYRQCRRQTFTDRVPAIASPYARRTTRVAEIVGRLGHSTGGRPGERLIRRLGMPISDDTILRHLKRYASWVDDEPPARIIGIDDWSWRKSRRYGTIIVDLERRKVMDILEDRSVASVARWFGTLLLRSSAEIDAGFTHSSILHTAVPWKSHSDSSVSINPLIVHRAVSLTIGSRIVNFSQHVPEIIRNHIAIAYE